MPTKKSVDKTKKSKSSTESTSEAGGVQKAHELAELDIKRDPDLNIAPERGDDLDEGELAQLEGEQ